MESVGLDGCGGTTLMDSCGEYFIPGGTARAVRLAADLEGGVLALFAFRFTAMCRYLAGTLYHQRDRPASAIGRSSSASFTYTRITMPYRRRAASCGVVALVFAAACPVAFAQAQPAGRETSSASVAGYALSQPMPVDPDVVTGTLPNGLRYYVRANGKPARRAELRLVVRAGSVLEDDDQRGLAHFVEHMEFEGTQHFPKQSLIDFLSALGLSIGPDANAATSYDDTQYTLRVPTDVPDVLDRALLVLEDWAHGATFDQTAIERERGIVLSEWRMHLGAGERTQDKIRQVQLEGSRYAVRTPMGNPDVIEHAQREQLTRFYRDWYRPDLMAVIVVGDVD